MKDAYGGIVNIMFISIFLTVAIGILGIVVSYTKAFKMKSEVIATIEEYEGSGCAPEINGGSDNTACRIQIKKRAGEIGYRPANLHCPTTNPDPTYKASNLYCYSRKKVGTDEYVYRVITQIDIGFPIIRDMMGLKMFQVAGDTKKIKAQN